MDKFRKLVVDQLLAEAESEPLVYHRVFALILAVDALAAHLYSDCKKRNVSTSCGGDTGNHKNDNIFRDHLATLSNDFRLLRDAANALKHVELIYKDPLVKFSNDIRSESLGFGAGAYGEGPYGGGYQIVVLDTQSSQRNAIALCKSAIRFIEEYRRKLLEN